MNSKIEITSGKPKPPFLMMAPRGAPIKNSKIHETANVNFLCHSTAYLALSSFLSSYLEDLLLV